MELEADRKCGWARSGGRGRRGGQGEGEGVDGGTIIPNDYPKLKDLLPIIKGVFFILHTHTPCQGRIRTGDLSNSV